MKYLSDYIEKPQEALFKKLGAFFAFNKHQLEASAKKGVKYTNLGAGTICPRENAKALVDGYNEIVKKGIEADKKDHTAEHIIVRELDNHEAFESWDIEDTVNKLKDYGQGFSREDIQEVFNSKTRKEMQ